MDSTLPDKLSTDKSSSRGFLPFRAISRGLNCSGIAFVVASFIGGRSQCVEIREFSRLDLKEVGYLSLFMVIYCHGKPLLAVPRGPEGVTGCQNK